MSADFASETFEFEMSMSYDDEYDNFDYGDEEDDFDYEDDDTLDDFDDDSDFYDDDSDDYQEEEVDDYDEPYDDVEPESGYSFRTHDAEELYDEDEANLFKDEEFDDD
ncbi:MAG: hypothetical protein MJ182_09480 [Treponema sp.]|nr:hypothetical protein [Treponema sp.]